ncbi:hypothetical protein FHP25_05090 [Vineibacter terrae]|uniref:Uncharacterized protein n=1 Tax=Vineibacter terrae TaxID=2586908 RepID=A0A5C8PU17_9HYPH|nr:hypothetical protein [Vineibacter terrae]TXL80407.1 hypothetical protein FHP25_05090 [Vineibacter terrae]
MSLAARHLETLGIPTLCLGSALDILEAGAPPRAVFVDYPLGHSAGRPFDPADQDRIVRAALQAFGTMSTPGAIVRLEARWDDDGWRAAAASTRGADTRMPRDTTPQYQTEDDRRLAEARARS